jgi:hypothetical protein
MIDNYSYDDIVAWMKEYFHTYATYGQNPETSERMYDYFVPDLWFMPYMASLKGPVTSRDQFMRNILSHPSTYEKLTPLDIAVDERRDVVTVIFKLEIIEHATDDVLVQKTAIAHYQLGLDEQNTLKIKRIHFFWEELLPEDVDVADVFSRDNPIF